MHSVKGTLERVYEEVRNGAVEVLSVLETFYELRRVSQRARVISLEEYAGLLEARKREAVSARKCSALESEVEKLRGVIRELI
jgi:hypothetical protein